MRAPLLKAPSFCSIENMPCFFHILNDNMYMMLPFRQWDVFDFSIKRKSMEKVGSVLLCFSFNYIMFYTYPMNLIYFFIKAVNFNFFSSIIMGSIKHDNLSWHCLWIHSNWSLIIILWSFIFSRGNLDIQQIQYYWKEMNIHRLLGSSV